MEVKGKSIQDIISMDMDDIMKMNSKDLKSLTNRLVSASNKRLKRLSQHSMGWISPVYQKEKFSTRNKGRNELLREFKKTKNFLTAKTSTVRGWNFVRADMEKNLGGRLPKGKTRKFWRVYRKFQETHYGGTLAIKNGSERMQKYIREEYVDNKIYDEDELLKRAEAYLDEEYMKSV